MSGSPGPAPDELRARATASVSWSLIAKVASQGATFVGTIVLARLLPVSDFGLVAMAQVYLGLLQQFVDAGFLEALIQRPTLTQREIASAFWMLLAAGTGAFLVSLLLRELVEAAFGAPGLGWVVVALSAILLVLPFRIVSQAVLAREVRLEALSKREALVNVLRLVASVWLAYRGAGIWSLVAPQVAAEVVFSLWCYRRSGWRLTPELSWEALRPLIRYGADMTASRLVWYASTRADQFVIGRVLGPSALGLYSLAWQFAGALPQFASSTLMRVVFPVFSRLQAETDRLRQTYLGITGGVAYAALPALVGLALVGPDLVGLVLDERWRPAIAPMQLLCLLAFLKMLESLSGYLINARAGTRRNLFLNVLSLAATVAGVSAGAAAGSLTAVSLLLSVAGLPVTLLFVRGALRECGGTATEWLAAVRGPLLATLFMAGGVAGLGAWLPRERHVLRLAVLVAAGAALYLAVTIPTARALVAQLRGRRAGSGAAAPGQA